MSKKNIIEISEDTKIPGTNIILEKGDKIEVLKERVRVPDELETELELFFENHGMEVWNGEAVDALRSAIVSAFQVGLDVNDVSGEENEMFEKFLKRMFKPYM